MAIGRSGARIVSDNGKLFGRESIQNQNSYATLSQTQLGILHERLQDHSLIEEYLCEVDDKLKLYWDENKNTGAQEFPITDIKEAIRGMIENLWFYCVSQCHRLGVGRAITAYNSNGVEVKESLPDDLDAIYQDEDPVQRILENLKQIFNPDGIKAGTCTSYTIPSIAMETSVAKVVQGSDGRSRLERLQAENYAGNSDDIRVQFDLAAFSDIKDKHPGLKMINIPVCPQFGNTQRDCGPGSIHLTAYNVDRVPSHDLVDIPGVAGRDSFGLVDLLKPTVSPGSPFGNSYTVGLKMYDPSVHKALPKGSILLDNQKKGDAIFAEISGGKLTKEAKLKAVDKLEKELVGDFNFSFVSQAPVRDHPCV